MNFLPDNPYSREFCNMGLKKFVQYLLRRINFKYPRNITLEFFLLSRIHVSIVSFFFNTKFSFARRRECRVV